MSMVISLGVTDNGEDDFTYIGLSKSSEESSRFLQGHLRRNVCPALRTTWRMIQLISEGSNMSTRSERHHYKLSTNIDKRRKRWCDSNSSSGKMADAETDGTGLGCLVASSGTFSAPATYC